MIFMTNNGKEEICGLKEQLAFRPALPVIDGEIVCNYDRGWDVRPTCKAAEVALEILLYEYDGRNEE